MARRDLPATVVALDKARNRPQADTAHYFAASAVDAASKNFVAPFKPVDFACSAPRRTRSSSRARFPSGSVTRMTA